MKQTLLLLHGALGTKSQFSRLIPELQDVYDVHAFNFEGHGDLPSEKAFTIDLFTQNLADYITKNNLLNVTIFGYSMGGYVALNYAKDHPQVVDKIITYGTKFEWAPETALKETGKLNPEKIMEKVPQFAHFLNKVHTVNDWKQVMNKTAQMMLNLGIKDALTSKDLQQISTQTLILIGSEDNMVSILESQFADSHLQNSKLQVLEGCVHPLEQNDTSIFTDLILDLSTYKH